MTKTQARRISVARRAIARAMIAEGLDPRSPADRTEHTQRLAKRIRERDQNADTDRNGAA